MADRKASEAWILRERILNAQLENIRALTAEAALEITIVCPLPEAHEKLVKLGYHKAGQDLYRFGESPRGKQLAEPRQATTRVVCSRSGSAASPGAFS